MAHILLEDVIELRNANHAANGRFTTRGSGVPPKGQLPLKPYTKAPAAAASVTGLPAATTMPSNTGPTTKANPYRGGSRQIAEQEVYHDFARQQLGGTWERTGAYRAQQAIGGTADGRAELTGTVTQTGAQYKAAIRLTTYDQAGPTGETEGWAVVSNSAAQAHTALAKQWGVYLPK